ncbi:MAG: type II CRISPR RNA-guided endonuclease Cas9, partial [Victivallaceae bacterium]
MKTLGLDLGTNSIGWAVVEKNADKCQLLNKGVHVFPKGVGDSQKGEYSLAAERTGYRSARRLKYRRKLRKLTVLKILSRHDYCPSLSSEELSEWRYQKKYPENKSFRGWLLTDDDTNKNPYYYRNLAAEIKLDLNDKKSRYMLGRAFYHLAQRRGYKSNALQIPDEANGEVSKAIEALQEAKQGLTLGQFFYKEYYGKHGKLDKNASLERIRNTYTSREQDYLDEFEKICEKQKLPENFAKELNNALFFQRPLKSQKGNIAKCPFEPKKQRIAVSHPIFERFRMFQFINNIKIKTPGDEIMRSLDTNERKEIEKLFYVKESFKFEKIVKRLCPAKAKAAYYRDKDEKYDYLFNYRFDTLLAPCRTTSQLMSLFEETKGNYCKLLEQIKINYLHGNNKTGEECLIDIWHVLSTFEDSSKRYEFGMLKLNLDKERANKFNKISLKQDYGQLSLKAVRKFMPLLEQGIKYSIAAFLANIPEVLKDYGPFDWETLYAELSEIIKSNSFDNQLREAVNVLIKTSREDSKPWNYNADSIGKYKSLAEKSLKQILSSRKWEKLSQERKNGAIEEIINIFEKQQEKNQTRGEFIPRKTIKEDIGDFLSRKFGVGKNDIEKIYHPSAIEVYPKANLNETGYFQLGSPRLSAVKNPVFMRTMFRLRALVNELLKQNIVDQDTRINIEMARELNDANWRKAITNYQRNKEKLRDGYRKKIEEFYRAKNISREISDTEILKYHLWEEQNHLCPYTGDNIGIEDFLGANPGYDIEHTFPRSRTCDNSQENLTLANREYNRRIKRNIIPAELAEHEIILQHIESFDWQKKVDGLRKQIERICPGTAATKEEKDKRITRRHELRLEHDYY